MSSNLHKEDTKSILYVVAIMAVAIFISIPYARPIINRDKIEVNNDKFVQNLQITVNNKSIDLYIKSTKPMLCMPNVKNEALILECK